MNFKLSRDKAKNRLLICGAYGEGNLGDEAILDCLLDEIYQKTQIPVTVLTREPKKLAKRLCRYAGRDFRAVHSLDPLGIIKELSQSRALILGGGSLLQDVSSKRSLAYYILVLKSAKSAGLSCLLYAAGIGPLSDEKTEKRAMKAVYETAVFAAARDKTSYEKLKKSGMNPDSLVLMTDPAIAVEANINYKNNIDSPYAVIALRKLKGRAKFADEIALFTDFLAEEYNLIPVFAALGPGDEKAAAEIIKKLKTKSGRIISCADAIKTAALIKNSEICISMRLHGLVLAASALAPAVGIAYDPKVSAFCEDMGYPYINTEEITAAALILAARNEIEFGSREKRENKLNELRLINKTATAEMFLKLERIYST
ncbi:MAG: polysaccharide pyruvyl transferase CsaB [Ruminococcaceae bacterium]|nr:polysaccharide pyruvyl transferase CsaB [Oscillospiraceae bacterium]